MVAISGGPTSHPAQSLRYRRGFPEELTLNAGLFARHADALCRLGPLRVHATAYNDVAYSDWMDDNLAVMREQDAYNQRLRDDISALVASPYTDRVASLMIGAAGRISNASFPAIMALLLTGASWPNLTALALGHDSLKWSSAPNWPTGDPWCGSRNSISGTTIGDAGVRALFTGADLPALQRLTLAGIELQDDGVCALAESAHLPALHTLDVGDYTATFKYIGDRGVRALAGAAHLAGLTSLRLCGCRIAADSVRALGTAPFWPGLTTLDSDGLIAMPPFDGPRRRTG